jgi:hypothetical protein
MSCVTLVHSRLSTATSSTSDWPSSVSFVAGIWRDLFKDFRSSYRPELHYMRGPGPRWREKHGSVLAHDGGIPAVGQPTEMSQRAAAQCPERRATAGRMSRETEMLVAIAVERGATPAREIVEARRVVIAELEQRRRLSGIAA